MTPLEQQREHALAGIERAAKRIVERPESIGMLTDYIQELAKYAMQAEESGLRQGTVATRIREALATK